MRLRNVALVVAAVAIPMATGSPTAGALTSAPASHVRHLTGCVPVGSNLVVRKVNVLRLSPNPKSVGIELLIAGVAATALQSCPTNGWYNVSVYGGNGVGWELGKTLFPLGKG